MRESLFGWEVANLLGLSNSKFLRTIADRIPHVRKGGVRLYSQIDVEAWQAEQGRAKAMTAEGA